MDFLGVAVALVEALTRPRKACLCPLLEFEELAVFGVEFAGTAMVGYQCQLCSTM